jgi:hypothetical protein
LTSSTSNFSAASIRILVVVVLALTGAELVTRVQLYAVSQSIRQFRTDPDRAAALARRDGLRVAVVGNSVAHENIDPRLLAARLEALRSDPVHAAVFSANHSFINAWHYIMTRNFWRPGNQVDLVVVPFWRDNLYDGNVVNVGRLAQFLTTFRDWPDVLRTDLTTFPERLDFVVSSTWASFASRDRIQQFLFTRLLPGYEPFAQLEQDVAVAHRTVVGEERPPHDSMVVLDRFLRAAKVHGSQLCFVAVPTMHPEWDDPYTAVRAKVAAAGMGWVDLRRMPDMAATDFRDAVHMTPVGASRFTRRLADALVEVPACAGTGFPGGA